MKYFHEVLADLIEVDRKVKEVGKQICPEVDYSDSITTLETLDLILGKYEGAVQCAEELKRLIDRIMTHTPNTLDPEAVLSEIHQIWIRSYS